MKQYAIVKDQISGEPFGLVVRDNMLDTCYGLSAKGTAWAESYNELETKSLQDELPYGVEVGDFRGMSSNEEILIADMIDGNRDVTLPNRESMIYAGSKKTGANSLLLDVSGAPLSFFNDNDFQDAVEFKVRSFLNESSRSSVMAKVRLDRLGVELKGLTFKSRDDNEYLSDDLANMANGSGLLRRTVKEVFEAKAEARHDHSGYSLSPFEPEVKALGPKLGGGLRSAPRGMSFVDITGRVDGDSDGIVFEGVPGMERPIIPRFMVPKNMARRISALVDGDSMEIEKQRRAGNANAAIDEGRLQELLGDQANLIRRIDGQGLQSRRAGRRNREADYPRMDPETVDRLRRERFVPETSPSGRARQNRIVNTPGADGGPSRRAVRERSGRVIPEPPARDRGGMRSQREMQSQRTDWESSDTNRPFYLRNDDKYELVSRRRDEFGRIEEIYKNNETGKFEGRQSGFSDMDVEGISIRDRNNNSNTQFDTAEEVQRVAEMDSRSQFEGSGGLASRREQNDDGSVPEGDFVDIDLTMEEVGYLSDIVDSIRDDIAAANDSEADELWQEFSDAIDDAAAGVDVVRLDRADAERLREMLEDIYNAEVEQGNPSPEEGDVLDLLGRAIDSPDGTWVSPSIEDNGGTRLSVGEGARSTRLARGDGQVRRDSRGNIIPEDSDRMNRLAESRDNRLRELGFDDDQIAQLTQGLRNRRAVDSMTEEELDSGLAFVKERVDELREELGIDKFWESYFEAHPEGWDNWVRNNFDGDFADGMAIADEIRRQRALGRDMMGRRSQMRRDAATLRRRNRRADYIRDFAEEKGFDPDEAELVLDEILEKIDEFRGDFPGEIDDDNSRSMYTPSRRRTGWGARINNEEETTRGRITEGPLKGATYEYFREQTWSESTFNDPSETLGGHHSLYVETPNGTMYRFEGDIEDELGLEDIHKAGGMRSTRATGKEMWTLVDGIDRHNGGYADLDDRMRSNIMEAAQVLNGNGHTGSAGSLMNDLRDSIRDLEINGRLTGISEEDRGNLSNMLQDAVDELVDRRKAGMSGLRAKRKGNQKKPKGGGNGRPNAEQRARAGVPEFSETSNAHVLKVLGFGENGRGAPKTNVPMTAQDRPLFELLVANNFVLDLGDGGEGGKIIVPDRLYLWSKTQGRDVISGWPRPDGHGRFQAPPGSGVAYRTTHFSRKMSFGREVEQWLKKIWGPDVIDDLKRNAKNGGRGKVGYVPSEDDLRRQYGAALGREDLVGIRSTRMSSSRRNPDRGITRSDRRAAQMDVTGTSGLGGGMRSRRRRGIAGKTKMSDTDGQAWESLSDTQRAVVEKAAKDRQGRLFWDITRKTPLDGARQNMIDDGLWRNDMSEEELKQVAPPDDLLPIMQAELDRALRDGEITATAHTSVQQQLDDLKTLSQMRRDNDYSMLEHLHAASKKRIIGDSRKEDDTIPTPAKLGLNSESSFYSSEAGAGAQAQTEAVAERAAKRKGKRRVPLSDRILRPDPERKQRRQNRRMRRTGQSGRRATEADVSATQTARRKLARLLRRARRKLRGKRDEGAIRKEYESRRKKLPLSRAADGTPIVDDKFVDFAGFINAQILKRQSGEISAKTQDDVLLNLWENGEMNGSPVLLDQDEFQALIDAGWTPIHRGMGRGKDTQGYVDSYKEDSDRFIPAQGGRAYGVGEYWATQRGGHWGHYGDGVVGFIDPSGVKKTAAEMSQIKSDHQKFANPIDDLMREVGEDALRLEDPANAVAQIRTRLDETEKRLGTAGLLEQSDMGRIYDQWLDMYAKMKPDDSRREKMWDALMYMQKMRKYDEGYYAPLLGIDYIDHGGVILVHNRGTVALLDLPEAINGNQADIIVNAAKGQ